MKVHPAIQIDFKIKLFRLKHNAACFSDSISPIAKGSGNNIFGLIITSKYLEI